VTTVGIPGAGPYETQSDVSGDPTFDAEEERTDLPEHEQDLTRRGTVDELEEDVGDAGMPAFEDDAQRTEDTATSETNP
jgi:hypothetical protein